MSDQKITIEFNDKVVRQFLLASVVWGAVGMVVGTLVATQLNYWQANFNLPWLTFGRLRPLHTNAVIFAFVGNMMFAGIYYSTQRLVKARLASDFLSQLHFWGWQLIIVAAAITLPLGFSRGKEYAELIWPINIAVTLIWVVFAVNFFGRWRNVVSLVSTWRSGFTSQRSSRWQCSTLLITSQFRRVGFIVIRSLAASRMHSFNGGTGTMLSRSF